MRKKKEPEPPKIETKDFLDISFSGPSEDQSIYGEVPHLLDSRLATQKEEYFKQL